MSHEFCDKVSTLMTSSKSISRRFHLLVQAHSWVMFNIWILGEHKHSVHSKTRYILYYIILYYIILYFMLHVYMIVEHIIIMVSFIFATVPIFIYTQYCKWWWARIEAWKYQNNLYKNTLKSTNILFLLKVLKFN